MLQVLRCHFLPASSSRASPEQTILSASAIRLQVTDAPASAGAQPERQDASKAAAIPEDLPLHQAWRDFSTAPFDLYKDAPVRLQVPYIICLCHAAVLCMSWLD